jgi:ankyrin repeat protein
MLSIRTQLQQYEAVFAMLDDNVSDTMGPPSDAYMVGLIYEYVLIEQRLSQDLCDSLSLDQKNIMLAFLALRGHSQNMDMLLRNGALFSSTPSVCQQPIIIMLGCVPNSQTLVWLLPQNLYDVNQQNDFGWTSLTTALDYECYENAKFLLRNGASMSVDIFDDTEYTNDPYNLTPYGVLDMRPANTYPPALFELFAVIIEQVGRDNIPVNFMKDMVTLMIRVLVP